MNKKSAYIIDGGNSMSGPLALQLERCCSELLEICGVAHNGAEALEWLSVHSADVLFIILPIPDCNIFDALQKLRQFSGRIVFVAETDEFALQAVKLRPLDYLLHPIKEQELIGISCMIINQSTKADHGLGEYLLNKETYLNDYLLVRTHRAIEKIEYSKITYIQAEGTYSAIYFDGRMVLSTKPIGIFESLSPIEKFIRCHKSYVIAKEYIARIDKGRIPKITLMDGTLIPVASRRKEKFNKWLRVSSKG